MQVVPSTCQLNVEQCNNIGAIHQPVSIELGTLPTQIHRQLVLEFSDVIDENTRFSTPSVIPRLFASLCYFNMNQSEVLFNLQSPSQNRIIYKTQIKLEREVKNLRKSVESGLFTKFEKFTTVLNKENEITALIIDQYNIIQVSAMLFIFKTMILELLRHK